MGGTIKSVIINTFEVNDHLLACGIFLNNFSQYFSAFNDQSDNYFLIF